ncbi:hypothetical protein MAR_010660 [Mya arenaria]|uniref:Uncharacterized protein n=1 Tax=Mya arenaria TaxID=6604 RepID=A0ABY7G0S7_MYAAR|nr:hypothetical protein MAR_010660 [Mya arenaria]
MQATENEKQEQFVTKKVTIKKQPSHLLNQERDGSIVFTWDDISDTNEGAVVTHFGMYNPVSKHFKK